MSEVLKPCPFCGDNSPELRYDFKDRSYHVLCLSCNAMGGNRSNKSYAISVWNRRAGE